MEIYVVVESTGRVKLRMMACDHEFTVHTRHVPVSDAQLKAIHELQEIEKEQPPSPWEPIFYRYFIRRADSVLTGAQVAKLLKGLGYTDPKNVAAFRDWLVQEKGVRVGITHGSRRYRGLALRGSGSLDRK